MKTIQTYFYIMTCFFMISGCSTMNDQFSCPMKPGVFCQSLDQVNAKIDKGEIKRLLQSKDQKSISPVESLSFNVIPLTMTTKVGAPPTRIPETLMPVWIAPYEDAHGNYHESSIIWIVATSGHWQHTFLTVPSQKPLGDLNLVTRSKDQKSISSVELL